MGIQTPTTFSLHKNVLLPRQAVRDKIVAPRLQATRDTLTIRAQARKPEGRKAAKSELKATPKAKTEFMATPKKEGPILAIVDDYESSSVPMFTKKPTPLSQLKGEAPYNGYVSHGHRVEAHAKLVAPEIQIHRVQIPRNRSGLIQLDVRTALQKLKGELDAGVPIDAVNISVDSKNVTIERIKDDLKLPGLNRENVQQYREQIRRNLGKIKLDPRFEHALGREKKTFMNDIAVLLEQIAEKVPVYLCAGNFGKESISLLSFAKGVITVGAVQPKGVESSANNGLVKRWARATKHFIPVKDEQGKVLGLTLTEADDARKSASAKDSNVLIPMDAVKMLKLGEGKWWNGLTGSEPLNVVQKGTSFASPQVAAKDLKRKNAFNVFKKPN